MVPEDFRSPNDIKVTALLVTELKEPFNKTAERQVHYELRRLHARRRGSCPRDERTFWHRLRA